MSSRPVWSCGLRFPDIPREAEAPAPMTVVLSTRIGSEAAKLIMEEQYGYMVGIVNGKVKKIPLKSAPEN